MAVITQGIQLGYSRSCTCALSLPYWSKLSSFVQANLRSACQFCSKREKGHIVVHKVAHKLCLVQAAEIGLILDLPVTVIKIEHILILNQQVS